ncbi:SPOCS domain-containing protein [Oscillospiraceae bacterium 44-34]
MEFERDTIISYETVVEVTLCQEETLESIVPDACPDILRIVDVCGQATLSGKQAREGAAQVTGMVRACILYQPEGSGGLRRMEVGLPFTCQAEAPGLTERGTVLAHPKLRCAEARALNPRKVLLRVDLAVDITACQPVERPVCCGVTEQEGEGLCQRQYQGEDYQLCVVQEKPFIFSDQVRLQSGSGESPALLAARVQPLCTESKLIGSKLIFKGMVELYLLLQEAGGGLSTSQESLPFSQIIETAGAAEEGDCQVEVEIASFRCEQDPGDSRELNVELELLAQAQVRCRRPVTLLQDLYSTSRLMEVQRENQLLCRLGEQSVRPQAVRELLETGEMVRSVVDARLSLGQVRQNREGRELVLTAETWITVLYLDENELVQCIRRSLPVTCRLECAEGSRCSCFCDCPGEVFAAPAAGGVEVRFTVEFHCLTTQTTAVPVVTAAQMGEARSVGEGQRPSVVLRMPSPGEELWDIAKAHGTTMERILQANELDEEALPHGRMLLIPSAR